MPSTINKITNIILVSPKSSLKKDNDIIEKLLNKHSIVQDSVVSVKDLYPILTDLLLKLMVSE